MPHWGSDPSCLRPFTLCAAGGLAQRTWETSARPPSLPPSRPLACWAAHLVRDLDEEAAALPGGEL